MRLIDIELHNILEEGNSQQVVELLNNGADPNSIHTNGYTVLMHAVRGSNLQKRGMKLYRFY